MRTNRGSTLTTAIDDLDAADAVQLSTLIEQLLEPVGPDLARRDQSGREHAGRDQAGAPFRHLTSGQRLVLESLAHELRSPSVEAAALRTASTGWDGLD